MNKRTSILLSTTMASIATAACAFCVAQSANAADVSASASTSSVSASTVSSAASSNVKTTVEKTDRNDLSVTPHDANDVTKPSTKVTLHKSAANEDRTESIETLTPPLLQKAKMMKT